MKRATVPAKRKTVDIDRGLFLVRYRSADDPRRPPSVRIALDADSAPENALITHPDAHEAVLFEPGTALAVRAVENGFSVAFHRLEDLLAALKRDADIRPARLRQRKHMNVALLVIDEVGFEPMSRQEASLFFRLVSYRYGRGSILITTNKGVAEWPGVLAGDEVLATAILDRLLHRCTVLNISGRSYRLRELERAAAGNGPRA